MPSVLTKTSLLPCTHGPGKVDLSAVVSKLKVLGDPVVTQGDITKVAGCTFVPPPGRTICTTATPTPGIGVSTKLRVGGKPVVLATITGLTNGGPTAPGTPFKVTEVQKKFKSL